MRKTLILFLLVVGLVSARPACAVEPDKVMHAGASFALGFVAGNQWPYDKPKAFLWAMVPGLAKEVFDSRKGGSGFSRADLAADALGAAAGVFTSHWLIARSQGTTVIAYRTAF